MKIILVANCPKSHPVILMLFDWDLQRFVFLAIPTLSSLFAPKTGDINLWPSWIWQNQISEPNSNSGSQISFSFIADELLPQSVSTLQCWFFPSVSRFLNSREIYSTCCTSSPTTDTCCRPLSPCSSSPSGWWCCWCCCWCGW